MQKQQIWLSSTSLRIAIIVVTMVIVFVAGFATGESVGVQQFIYNSCAHYPFLLIDSNTHVACTLP